MATKPGAYKKILVPVDGSDASKRGLREAIRLARSFGAKLRLVHVVDTFLVARDAAFTLSAGEMLDVLTDQGKKVLAQAKAAAAKAGVKAETALNEGGAPRVADGIVAEARKSRANLIVMGTHGRRGLSHLVLGSDAELVIRESSVPVLLVRGARTAKRKSRSRR